MTGSQRLVLMLGLMLLAGCLLYPPWHFNALPGAPNPVFRSLGYTFLFSAPITPAEEAAAAEAERRRNEADEPLREQFLTPLPSQRVLDEMSDFEFSRMMSLRDLNAYAALRASREAGTTPPPPAPPPYRGPMASFDLTQLFMQMGAVAALTAAAFVALGWRRKS